MKNYDHVLFDLDGTIADSGVGVINCVEYALKKFDMGLPTDIPHRLFMGPSLMFSFTTYCHLSEEKAEKALVYYRERYSREGVTECSIYPGIKELFQRISDAGKTLLVASAKPEAYVRIIMKNFGVDHLFTYIGGAEFDGSRDNKWDIIAYTLESAGITDTANCVMIGDRKYDVEGAKHFGMDCIGVLYGYGDEAELREAGAEYLAEDAEAIADILGL